MTKNEIKALIASKLAGQGTNIDAASVLPSILEGIIDLIPTLPEPYELPVATDEVLGGVKVGENLSITEDGVLSAQAGAGALIISGSQEDGNFTPAEEQPTIEDAISAFAEGRMVLLNADPNIELVTANNDGILKTSSWTWTVG